MSKKSKKSTQIYIGSIVLGFTDALIELMGTLAGLTLALPGTRLIAMVGLITGVAASFSMMSSEYLSIKAQAGDKRNPIKGAIYTGGSYLLTVIVLITPFLLFNDVYESLTISILLGVIIIGIFTYKTSPSQKVGFKKSFFEMTVISLGVAALSFAFGYMIKHFFGIEI